jgi:hypothetical protein
LLRRAPYRAVPCCVCTCAGGLSHSKRCMSAGGYQAPARKSWLWLLLAILQSTAMRRFASEPQLQGLTRLTAPLTANMCSLHWLLSQAARMIASIGGTDDIFAAMHGALCTLLLMDLCEQTCTEPHVNATPFQATLLQWQAGQRCSVHCARDMGSTDEPARPLHSSTRQLLHAFALAAPLKRT